MRLTLGTAFIALALSGCADSQFAGSLFYLKPYNIENQTCAQLKASVDGTTAAATLKSDLREKAATNPVGSAVGAAVYGPDQNASLWLHRQYQAEYDRKNCAAAPAASPGPAAAAPPAASPPPAASTPASAMPPITPPPR